MFASISEITDAAVYGGIETVTVHTAGPIDRSVVVYVSAVDMFETVTDRDGTLYNDRGDRFSDRDAAAFSHAVAVVLGHADM